MKAVNKRYSASQNTPTLAADARRLIEEQTAAFLKLGGRIQHIPNGVSGQVHAAGPRHISFAQPSDKKE